MKLSGTGRLIRQLTHRVGRSAVLIGLAWSGHAQALPMQVELGSYQAAAQHMAMTDCPPCASCHMAPPLAECGAGGDDLSEIAASPWAMLLEPVDSHEYRTSDPVRPMLALRILYCRWLN